MLPQSRLEKLLDDEILVRFIVNRDAKLQPEMVLEAVSGWKK